MKERILAHATVFSQPSRTSPALWDCAAGDELELGKFKKAQNELWVEATLPDGSTGFLPANTRRERAGLHTVGIPVQSMSLSVQFPERCVYCNGESETYIAATYDEKPRNQERGPDDLLVQLQIPFCNEHAQESKLNSMAVTGSFWSAFVLGILACVAVVLFIQNSGGIFGQEEGDAAFILALVAGIPIGLAVFVGIMLLANRLAQRYLPAADDLGLVLGLWVSRVENGKTLDFKFTNQAYAAEFRRANIAE